MSKLNDVKELRSILGISQKELAEKLGVSIRTVANYEAGGVIPMNKQLMIESMLSNAKSVNVIGDSNITNTGIVGESLVAYGDVVSLKKRIKELEEENKQLRKDKEMLQDFITFLQDKGNNKSTDKH